MEENLNKIYFYSFILRTFKILCLWYLKISLLIAVVYCIILPLQYVIPATMITLLLPTCLVTYLSRDILRSSILQDRLKFSPYNYIIDPVSIVDLDEIHNWCSQHIDVYSFDYDKSINGLIITFIRKSDLIMFKLRWT